MASATGDSLANQYLKCQDTASQYDR